MGGFREVNINPNTIGTDAGGRLRVSQYTTLFDGKILNSDESELFGNAGTGRVLNVFPAGNNAASHVFKENYLSYLSINIDNVPDEYVLAYMPTTTNQVIYGTSNLKEY